MRVLPWLLMLSGTLAGCAAWRGGEPDVTAARPPVVLRLHGPVAASAAARADAMRALGRATHRRVELADDAVNDTYLRDVAARARVRRHPGRERRCASHADVLVAARAGADAVYVLTLTEGPSRGLLAGSTVTGEASVRMLDGSAKPPRVAVAGDDVAAAVTAAVAGLPAVSGARWDVVAKTLLDAGCPMLALAVQELRLGDGKAGRSVRQRALAAMGRGPATPKPVAVAPEPAPVVEVAAKPPPSETRFSCEALCGIHMVEVCNKDRTLWNQHLVAWERTGCGTRRTEPFLVECYRRQRISGTFHDACVAPCEGSAAGRSTLLEMLQGAGCLRSGPS